MPSLLHRPDTSAVATHHPAQRRPCCMTHQRCKLWFGCIPSRVYLSDTRALDVFQHGSGRCFWWVSRPKIASFDYQGEFNCISCMGIGQVQPLTMAAPGSRRDSAMGAFCSSRHTSSSPLTSSASAFHGDPRSPCSLGFLCFDNDRDWTWSHGVQTWSHGF